MTHIAHVDGKFLCVLRDLNIFLRQHKGTLFSVEGEHHHTVTHRQHQHGLRTVNAVTGGHLACAGLQEVVLTDRLAVRFLQHTEDGADADVDIDVARAIQRIKQQQILALRVAIRHHVNAVHFFGRHGGEVTAPFVGFDQYFVGNDVEFFLHFALHVLAAGAAQDIAQGAFVDCVTDALAGTGNDL